MVTTLLILAVPIVGSAQFYNRDRYDRSDRADVHDAIVRLDSSSAQLESDLSYMRGRRVLGIFWVTNSDPNAAAEVREFRNAVRQLRYASRGGRDIDNSYDEARMVVDRGIQLDRYLRLRTGQTSVDADLSEIRSSLNVIANAYDLTVRY